MIRPRSPEFNVGRRGIQVEIAKVGVFVKRLPPHNIILLSQHCRRGAGGRRMHATLKWAFIMKTPVHFFRWCIHHICDDQSYNSFPVFLGNSASSSICFVKTKFNIIACVKRYAISDVGTPVLLFWRRIHHISSEPL